MAAKDSAKILEEFMRLASNEIDVVAKRIQFEPAAQATAVEMLHEYRQRQKIHKIYRETTALTKMNFPTGRVRWLPAVDRGFVRVSSLSSDL